MDHHQPVDESVRAIIAKRLRGLTTFYESQQNCKRKTVVTVAWGRWDGGLQEIGHWVNGPLHRDPTRCSNQVGGCGCIHSEVRAVCDMLRSLVHMRKERTIIGVTYSPCTPCANLIMASYLTEEIYWLIDTEHDMRGIEILQHLGTAERIG